MPRTIVHASVEEVGLGFRLTFGLHIEYGPEIETGGRCHLLPCPSLLWQTVEDDGERDELMALEFLIICIAGAGRHDEHGGE